MFSGRLADGLRAWPRAGHGLAMGWPWRGHGAAMALPWLSHGSANARPWFGHGLAMARPWLGHGLAMALPYPYMSALAMDMIVTFCKRYSGVSAWDRAIMVGKRPVHLYVPLDTGVHM